MEPCEMNKPTVACVLRSGGEYHPWHVAWLHSQVARRLPGLRFVCLSDVPVTCERLPLLYGWPGWWSKVELFRPEIKGDTLFFDLDTVIVGDLSTVASVGRTTLLSDMGNADLIARKAANSSVMYLTESDRAQVWERWIADPNGHMARYGELGDQAMIGEVLYECDRWQDVLPGALLSYKIDVFPGETVRADCAVVYFHGRPRPWKVAADWMPRPGNEASLIDSTWKEAYENRRLTAENQVLRTENQALGTENQALRTENQVLRASTSWRVTYPLRFVVNLARRSLRWLKTP